MYDHYMTSKTYKRMHSKVEEIENRLKKELPKKFGAFENYDWMDDAPYEALQDKQQELIRELRRLYRRMSGRIGIIDGMDDLPEEIVTIGKEVDLVNLNTSEEEVYYILGPEDIDTYRDDPEFERGTVISYASPIAKALFGKGVDAIVTLGNREFRHTCRIVKLRQLFGKRGDQ